MSIGSAYDDILEDMQCPNPECGHVGMESDGSYSFRCPECGATGTL